MRKQQNNTPSKKKIDQGMTLFQFGQKKEEDGQWITKTKEDHRIASAMRGLKFPSNVVDARGGFFPDRIIYSPSYDLRLFSMSETFKFSKILGLKRKSRTMPIIKVDINKLDQNTKKRVKKIKSRFGRENDTIEPCGKVFIEPYMGFLLLQSTSCLIASVFPGDFLYSVLSIAKNYDRKTVTSLRSTCKAFSIMPKFIVDWSYIPKEVVYKILLESGSRVDHESNKRSSIREASRQNPVQICSICSLSGCPCEHDLVLKTADRLLNLMPVVTISEMLYLVTGKIDNSHLDMPLIAIMRTVGELLCVFMDKFDIPKSWSNFLSSMHVTKWLVGLSTIGSGRFNEDFLHIKSLKKVSYSMPKGVELPIIVGGYEFHNIHPRIIDVYNKYQDDVNIKIIMQSLFFCFREIDLKHYRRTAIGVHRSFCTSVRKLSAQFRDYKVYAYVKSYYDPT